MTGLSPCSPLPILAPADNKRVAVANAHRVVVFSDLQIPYEDTAAVDQAIKTTEHVKPDLLIINGDGIDCYAESAFLKDSIKAEESLEIAHEKVRRLMKRLAFAPVRIWLGGNHEDRWRRLLWSGGPTAMSLVQKHQAISGVSLNLADPVGSFAALYAMPEHGFVYYPYGHRLYLAENNLVVTHGKYVSRHAGWAAKRTWEWLGKSAVVGHTHRIGSYLITQDGREMGAWENGCLCQLEPEYDDAPNWQQGFSVVRIDGPEFHVVQVPIVRRGKVPVAVYHGEAA